MISLMKIAILSAGLVLAGCHIEGDPNKGHATDGSTLDSNGNVCSTARDLNINGIYVSEPSADILLKKLGYDPIEYEEFTVYTTNSDTGVEIGFYVTDNNNCVVMLGEFTRTELARMLGMKIFGGID